MPSRASRAVATTLALVALAMEVATAVLFVRDTAATRVTLDSNGVATLILGASFPVVGWLITSVAPITASVGCSLRPASCSRWDR